MKSSVISCKKHCLATMATLARRLKRWDRAAAGSIAACKKTSRDEGTQPRTPRPAFSPGRGAAGLDHCPAIALDRRLFDQACVVSHDPDPVLLDRLCQLTAQPRCIFFANTFQFAGRRARRRLFHARAGGSL